MSTAKTAGDFDLLCNGLWRIKRVGQGDDLASMGLNQCLFLLHLDMGFIAANSLRELAFYREFLNCQM